MFCRRVIRVTTMQFKRLPAGGPPRIRPQGSGYRAPPGPVSLHRGCTSLCQCRAVTVTVTGDAATVAAGRRPLNLSG